MTQDSAIVAVQRPAPSRGAEAPRLLDTATGKILSRLGVIVLLLLAWEYLPDRSVRFWASSPSAIVATVWRWLVDGSLWAHLGATLSVMTVGYLVGCATGVATGLLFGFLPKLHRILSPYITAVYALPKIALAPLLIILLGVGMASKVTLVAVTVFFLLFTSTLDGVRNIDRDFVQAVDLMGASRAEVIRKVLLPGALPWVFTGMRISVRYAFTTTILSELIAANQGLGFLIEYNSSTFNATGAYAAIVVMVIFSVALTELLTRVERYLPRQVDAAVDRTAAVRT